MTHSLFDLSPDREHPQPNFSTLLAEQLNRYCPSCMTRLVWSGTISFGQIDNFPHQDRR
jgi:hypothetical protein